MAKASGYVRFRSLRAQDKEADSESDAKPVERRNRKIQECRRTPHATVHQAIRRQSGDPLHMAEPWNRSGRISSRTIDDLRADDGAGTGAYKTHPRRMKTTKAQRRKESQNF